MAQKTSKDSPFDALDGLEAGGDGADAGLPPWGDEVDPELVAMGDARGDSVLRPMLMIAVLVLGGYIISDWSEELAYFFSPSEPVVLGAVTDFPSKVEANPSWTPDIPHNRLVRVEGIPSRRAISKSQKFFKLVGGEVYVQVHRDEDKGADPKAPPPAPTLGEGFGSKPVDRTYFSGVGRAMAFDAMPQRYQRLRDFYRRTYDVDFCVDLSANERAKIERKRREAIVQTWAKRYEDAPAAEREAQKLTPSPSDAQIAEILRREPACINAFLVQEGVEPKDHWWYLALTLLFGGFMITDLVLLGRWFKRALAPKV